MGYQQKIMLAIAICIATITSNAGEQTLRLGAEQFDAYAPLLKDKRVGLVVNHTSAIEGQHLLDFLLEKQIAVAAVFAPEHGFRGTADAGENVQSGIDSKTGVPIISLYGCETCRMPSKEQTSKVDTFVFDMQDVGTRFYTYISTMHYVMEACAAYDTPLVILDRPNPNGDYIAGPILDIEKYQSFIGMHPIPVVHGLTVGELAQMINGEGWLKNGKTCDVTVIPMQHYNHRDVYEPPIQPSPNLPNYHAIRWYPSLVLFEHFNDNPNAISIGRGTDTPFEFIGYPDARVQQQPAVSARYQILTTKAPKKGQVQGEKIVYGVDLRQEVAPSFSPRDYILWVGVLRQLDPTFSINQQVLGQRYGNDDLYDALQTADFSREGWLEMLVEALEAKTRDALERYKTMRMQYLLYP